VRRPAPRPRELAGEGAGGEAMDATDAAGHGRAGEDRSRGRRRWLLPRARA
jgi:hypothetical protein